MITVLVTITLKPGRGPELEQYFRDASKAALSHPLGPSLYKLCRTEDRDRYRIVEFYDTQEALDAHLARIRARTENPLEPLIAAPIVAEFLNDV